MENGERYPTWPKLWSILAAMLTAQLGTGTWLYTMHASRPHHGAASIEYVVSVENRTERTLTRIDDRITRLEGKIDKLMDKVNGN